MTCATAIAMDNPARLRQDFARHSLFVIAFGVVTAQGTLPITLGVQIQRGGKGSAAHVTPELVRAIADYLC